MTTTPEHLHRATDQPVALPTAWNLLHHAISRRQSVRARYNNKLRVLCPHALGWKNGRAKVLVYQAAIFAPTSAADPQGWRTMFVDQIQDLTLTDDPWHSANNYTPRTTGIDTMAIAIS